MPRAFLPDGYTFRVVIESPENYFEPVEVKYRPSLPEENAAFFALQNSDDIAEAQAATRKFLVDHVVSWSLMDCSKQPERPVAITVENMGRLSPAFRSKLMDLITGFGSAKSVDEPAEIAVSEGNSDRA